MPYTRDRVVVVCVQELEKIHASLKPKEQFVLNTIKDRLNAAHNRDMQSVARRHQAEVKEKLKATTKEIDRMSDDYEAEIERLKDAIRGQHRLASC